MSAPKIFITGINFRLPGISSLIKLNSIEAPVTAKSTLYDLEYQNQLQTLHLDLDEQSKYFPSQKDVKVMREDVIAATICAQELLDSAKIETKERANIPLYMSNGTCLDQYLNNINNISAAYFDNSVNSELATKHKRVERVLPPLFVLNALTNSACSFVSQYSGIKGDSTVYGNTSHATIDALAEGISNLKNMSSSIAVVGAANGAGLFFALTFNNFSHKSNHTWRMSNAAIMILLETEESLRGSSRAPLAEIALIKTGKNVPRLVTSQSKNIFENYYSKSSMACFSGGLRQVDFETEKTALQNKYKTIFSLYPHIGCAGTVSPIINIALSCNFLKHGHRSVDCLNRDPFGRESLITLQEVL